MKTLKCSLSLATVLLLSSACAGFRTVQTDYSYEPTTGKVIRKITTRAKSTTFFDSKSNLAKWKASQTDKTQGAEVGGLLQESTATNLVTISANAENMMRMLAK